MFPNYATCSVEIPLGQGQVFNESAEIVAILSMSQSLWVRDRFLIKWSPLFKHRRVSQSLWVRDRFLILADCVAGSGQAVAIPLGQGQVFN